MTLKTKSHRLMALLLAAVAGCLLSTAPAAAQDEPATDEGCTTVNSGDPVVPRNSEWNTRSYVYKINNDTIPAGNRSVASRRKQARRQIVRGHNNWATTRTDCRRNGKAIRNQKNFSFVYAGLTPLRFRASRDDNGNGMIDEPGDDNGDGTIAGPEETYTERDGWDGESVVDFGTGFPGDSPERPSCMPTALACGPRDVQLVDHDGDGASMNATPPELRIVEADIRVDEAASAWYQTSRRINPKRCIPPRQNDNGCYDLYGVIVHETGHNIGLSHSCNAPTRSMPNTQRDCSDASKSQTMNGIAYANFAPKGSFPERPDPRTLGIADIRALRANYPRP